MVGTGLYGQGSYRVRFDWGPAGAAACAADVAVIVDVLSFSTSVTIAVERGMQVHPYAWNDERAVAFAASMQAVLAVGRLEAAKGGVVAPSLSPAALLECDPVPRLVLPSPNGSTIAAALAETGAAVLIGSLRNASAVGRRLAAALDAGCSVAVIAAGERWGSDDSLRPALEDAIGAGAVLRALGDAQGSGGFSPEALAAAESFDAARDALIGRLRGCVSGRELIERGFGADVEAAAAVDVSSIVPELVTGAFTAR